MNRKIVIIISIIGLLLVVGIFFLVDFLSYRTVDFKFEGEGYSVLVGKGNENITTLDKSGSVRLKDGVYQYRVGGKDYNKQTVEFTVNDSMSITINPTYSESYLASLLEKEIESIQSTIISAYPAKKFRIETIKLYEKGDWAGGVLQPIGDPREPAISYRFLLQKIDNKWSFIIPPQIAINKEKYPNVPASVIYALYQ